MFKIYGVILYRHLIFPYIGVYINIIVKKMTKLKRLLVVFLLCAQSSLGQVDVYTAVPTSPPVTSCTTTFLTVTGLHYAAGYTYLGATVNIVGSVINVSLNYSFAIGISILVPFTQSVDIGMIPGGSYTLNVNGILNGNTYSPYSTSLVSTSCCSAVSSFTSSATSVCVGDFIQFSNTSTGSIGQAWANNSVPVGTTLNYSLFATTPGPLVITLAVTNGTCFDSVSQTIDVLSIPVVDSITVSTASACIGQVIVFNGYSQGSVGASGRKWLKDGVQVGTGAILPSVTSGVGIHTYSFIATNGYCSDTMDIQVEFFAPPSITNFNVGPVSICPGETVNCTSATSGATSLTWKLNNVVSGTGNNFTNVLTTPGNYQYRLVASNGVCADSSSASVTVVNPPAAPNLGADSSYCTGLIVLDAGVASSYLWNDGSTNQYLNVTAAGTYWVTITNSAGCNSTDTIVFTSCLGIEELGNSFVKIAPNPVQDNFEIQFDKSVSETNVSISSASGKVVFNENYLNKKSIQINTVDYESGVYFVAIQSIVGKEVIKIVKQD